MATPNLISLATVSPGLLDSRQLASGDNTTYTVGASKAAKLASLTLCNTGAAAVTVSVSIVPSGGTVDATHRIVSGYSLAAGDTLGVDEVRGMWLGAGAFVSINVSAATSVDSTLSGLEFA